MVVLPRGAASPARGGSTVSYVADYLDRAGAGAERFFKSTLVQSERLLLGLNCLEPGQAQAVYAVPKRADPDDATVAILRRTCETLLPSHPCPE
jgi:hypothetical protein